MPAKSERQREEIEGRGQEFFLNVPGQLEIYASREKPIKERTALWVPYNEAVKHGFSPSKTWPEVLVSQDVIGVLRTVARFGQTSLRKAELEEDPLKQQIIFYTAIICRDHLLWYQRAGEQTTKLPAEMLGDERLRGKYSIGWGGHKTEDDILSVEGDLLDQVISLVSDEVKMMVGVNRGFLAEIGEETGIRRENFAKTPRIIGAFMDRRNVPPEDPRYNQPVGFVHLSLPTIIEISPDIGQLRFSEREAAWAGWVPLAETEAKLEEVLKSPYGVDSWTEVFIREFLSELRT